jgi:hypothetical protein
MGLVTLPSGRAFIVGGYNQRSNAYLDDAAVFDPETSQWSPIDPVGIARGGHSTTVLVDGSVLIAGGLTNGGALTPTCELGVP